MALIRRRAKDAPRSAAERRAARIATPDLSSWVEQALYGMDQALRQSRRPDAFQESVRELEMGAEALLAVVREMRRRARLD